MNRSVLLLLSLFTCARLLGAAAEPASKSPAPNEGAAQTPEALEARERARLEASKWVVRVDVQMVAMPQERAMKLIPEFQSSDPKKAEQNWAAIQEMIAKKEATLLAWPALTLQDGQRSVTEAIDEVRYPVGFTPEPPATPGKPRYPDEDLSVPSEFETRNTGVTLEAEAKVADEGERILVSLVPQRVALNGWKAFGGGADGKGGASVEQPQFATSKVTTSVSVRNNERMLIAVHGPGAGTNQIELFILHAVASKVK